MDVPSISQRLAFEQVLNPHSSIVIVYQFGKGDVIFLIPAEDVGDRIRTSSDLVVQVAFHMFAAQYTGKL